MICYNLLIIAQITQKVNGSIRSIACYNKIILRTKEVVELCKTIDTNKHHLLYPEIAFSDYDKALYLRKFFVVKTPLYLHTQLHNELDRKHSIGLASFQITSKFLPRRETIDELFAAFEKERATKLEGRTAGDLLRWLNLHLKDDADHLEAGG